MKDVKQNIANNIVKLRKAYGLSQGDLAKKLNYTDKAISKWERNESTPDVNSIYEMSKLFDVPIEFFFLDNTNVDISNKAKNRLQNKKQRYAMCALFITAVWLFAIIVFCYPYLANQPTSGYYLSLIWAIPVSSLIALVFGLKNKLKIFATVMGSLLLWTLLLAIYLTLLFFGFSNLWMIFIIGIPLEFAIVISHFLRISSR